MCFPPSRKLIGAEVPTDRMIDGKDIWPLMAGEAGAKSPHDVFYCYYDRELRAVRDRAGSSSSRTNIAASTANRPAATACPRNYKQLKTKQALYDLKNDVGETTDVAADHPEIVARLERAAEKARATLGDTLTGRKGSEVRPPGKVASDGQCVAHCAIAREFGSRESSWLHSTYSLCQPHRPCPKCRSPVIFWFDAVCQSTASWHGMADR